MKSRRGSSDTGKTVLVVDRDPRGALIAQALSRRGFDVAQADSSDSALKSVRDAHPAAVVVVIEPPAATSFLPLVRELGTSVDTAEIPVIVTRCDDDSLLTQAQRLGNVVVLLGDCTPETVATEVDRVVLESAGAPAAPVQLQFPVICPQCGERSGVPRSVSTAANQGTYICLCCEKCSQQWRVFRQADTSGSAKP